MWNNRNTLFLFIYLDTFVYDAKYIKIKNNVLLTTSTKSTNPKTVINERLC